MCTDAVPADRQNSQRTYSIILIVSIELGCGALKVVTVGPAPKPGVELVKDLLSGNFDQNTSRLVLCEEDEEKKMRCKSVSIPDQTEGAMWALSDRLVYCKQGGTVLGIAASSVEGWSAGPSMECLRPVLTSWIKKYDPEFVDDDAME